ncbi:hypothetical protein QCA50_010996 [Cerrena zonata]|uniref:Uncharacterized protein n=1 Tax=Cerrena zonata TaxID=2478898 RepID=A0AAW0G2C7_9APHY
MSLSTPATFPSLFWAHRGALNLNMTLDVAKHIQIFSTASNPNQLEAQEADADRDVELDNNGDDLTDEGDDGSRESSKDPTDKAKYNAEDGTNETTVLPTKIEQRAV